MMSKKLEQEIISMPRIGDKAPEFEALTTRGIVNFPNDYIGKWTILFSQPAHFTTVSTTKPISFDHMIKDFDKANCELIELSIEGHYSQIAWLQTIKEEKEYESMKDIKISFPLVEDITMEVAHKYGIIQSYEKSTTTVSTVFFIDPKGIIRTIIYYPLSMRRNYDALYRIEVALQTAEKFGIDSTADWQAQDDVTISQTGSCKVENDREKYSKLDCTYWFF